MLTASTCPDTRLRKELTITAPVGRGRSKSAKLVQELLAVNGISVVIDGDIGSATLAGLAKFSGNGAVQSVDQALMDRLAQPLLRAVQPTVRKASLGDSVVAVARQHLREHPLEIGGANRGPWVRLYMDGNEGEDFPWCAGFVTYVIRAAAQLHDVPNPVARTYSCDTVALRAEQSGRLEWRISPANAKAGSVFLVPRKNSRSDWIHTGIITGGDGTNFATIEGNTNDSGSREGVEVCARTRACKNVDVVLLEH